MKSLRNYLGLGIVIVLSVLPFSVSPFYTYLALKIFVFAILLLSYDLMAGYTGLVSLGHAMFFGIGAYTAALILLHLTVSIWFALFSSLLLSLAIAVLIGYLSIRTRGVYFIFITLAFSQFFYLIAYHWTGVTGGDNGLPGIPNPSIGIPGLVSVDLGVLTNYYYFVLVCLVLSYLICKRIIDSPFGKVLVAIKENEERTEFLGYDVKNYKRKVFTISGALGGVAGALFAIYQNFVSPELLHWHLSVEVIIMTWLGGVGTLIGPVLGGAVVIYFRELFSGWLGEGNWVIIMGGIYILFVLFSPKGIVGLIEKARGWTSRAKG